MNKEEMKALVEMKDMLKAENTKLKQKLEEMKNYIKENACYDEKTKECKCSFSSMALDKILEIIGGE